MPQAHIEHCVLLYACTFGWSAYTHFTVLTKHQFIQWKPTACRAQDMIMNWPFLADSMAACINTPVPFLQGQHQGSWHVPCQCDHIPSLTMSV